MSTTPAPDRVRNRVQYVFDAAAIRQLGDSGGMVFVLDYLHHRGAVTGPTVRDLAAGPEWQNLRREVARMGAPIDLSRKEADAAGRLEKTMGSPHYRPFSTASTFAVARERDLTAVSGVRELMPHGPRGRVMSMTALVAACSRGLRTAFAGRQLKITVDRRSDPFWVVAKGVAGYHDAVDDRAEDDAYERFSGESRRALTLPVIEPPPEMMEPLARFVIARSATPPTIGLA